MSGPKTILVLGGGVGGLVDREREHLFAPSLLWLMVGERSANAIRRPLQRLERKGIEVR